MDLKTIKRKFGISVFISALAILSTQLVAGVNQCVNETYNVSCVIATLWSELVGYMWLIAIVIILIVAVFGLRYITGRQKG